jgi:CRISPR-associated protein Csx14
MNGKALRSAALIATLGTRPQVVTIALDLLLDDEIPIEEVLVIHTASSPPRPGAPRPTKDLMAESLRDLRREFPGEVEYLHRGTRRHRCRLETLQLEADDRPIDDVHSDTDAEAVFTALFNAVQELKKRRYVIHLSIAGGRKSMSVYGMATAQLLFDSRDRLYHLFSSPEFEDLGLMHPRGPEDTWLVPIPVLPVSTVFPGMVTILTSREPLRVLKVKQAVMMMEERRNRREFVEGHLSPAERRLVEALMEAIVLDNRSLSNSELARKLVITPRVVANRFTDIYNKLGEYLELPTEEQVDRNILVHFLTPYYT